jgi:hypothetical protein
MSGTVTTTTFTPPINAPFQFQATLLDPTPLVTATGTTFNVYVLWNTADQRWYVQVQDQSGNVVINRPLVASTTAYGISLTAGYFTSTMYYYDDTISNQFVVTS